jgi:hypothetical protein
MIDLVLAFLLGGLVNRLYYALSGERTDWMRSSDWSSNKYYQRAHRVVCYVCPKRHYCMRYINYGKIR